MSAVGALAAATAALSPAAAGAEGNWTLVTAAAPFAKRTCHQCGAVHGGELVIAGGRRGGATFYADVWASPDGVRWEQRCNATPWAKRAYHALSSVNGSLVLTGGQSGLLTFSAEVWRSGDGGRGWERLHDAAPFGPRTGHAAAVRRGELLVFGGGHGNIDRHFYGDVWASADAGETWTLRANGTAWNARTGMAVVVVGDALFLIGGDNEDIRRGLKGPYYHDVWRSDDAGATWSFVGNAPWTNRSGHECTVAAETVYCAGGVGYDTELRNHHDLWAWEPLSGGAWRRVTARAWGCAEEPKGQCGRADFFFAAAHGALWTVAGDEESSLAPFPQDNDVWTVPL